MSDAPAILVLGATARYACLSLHRGGFRCEAVDLFADCETRLAGPAERVRQYPDELFERLASRSDCFWMYTGGLENQPDWVERMEALPTHRLLGCSAAALRMLRDLPVLPNRMPDLPIRFPPTKSAPPDDGERWLFKSVHSCGGLGVRTASDRGRSKDGYFQRRVEGEVLGATYLATADGCRVLGVTKALDDQDRIWTGAGPFHYSGSLGPIQLPSGERQRLENFGRALAQVEGVRGVIGVDFIRDGDGELWWIDINPRLPASAEALERANDQSIAALHVDACSDKRVEVSAPDDGRPIVGKAILYARRPIHSTAKLRQFAATDSRTACDHWLGDTPADDSPIETGHPIATVFADGEDEHEVRAGLRARAKQVREALL